MKKRGGGRKSKSRGSAKKRPTSREQPGRRGGGELRDRTGKPHGRGTGKGPHSGKHRRPLARRGGPARLKATVDKNHKGFAFLAFDDRSFEDAFVPPREAQRLFHGDRVEVALDQRGRVASIEILEHRFRELVGRYSPHPSGSKGGWVIYERKRAREEVFIPAPDPRAKTGDWIRVRLEFQDRGEFLVQGVITEVYGPDLPPSADIGMVAAEYNLIEFHSPEAERQARELKLEIPGRDLDGRDDLRHLPFITIDGETARDFDDAIYVERDRSGFSLWVAIADVSHYVTERTALDLEARSRGTSVYFPERAFHMLPRALSENLCSLKPGEPRLSMVAKMRYDLTGDRQSTELIETVIESKRRATYEQIQAEQETRGKDPSWEYHPHFELYRLIRGKRSGRGSIDFDLPEAEIKVEPTGEVVSIRQRSRLDSHRLIEEFMIAANEAVTDWMLELDWPFVYRVHGEPAMQSLIKFQQIAANAGVHFSLEGDAAGSPRMLAELVRRLEGNPAQALLNLALLRSMKQAVYSSTHGIHFGLASEGYTHFTSPIRRYPDLVVHRLLRHALRMTRGNGARTLPPKERENLEKELADITEHCSYRERIAADAERESIKLKQVRAMAARLGDEFEGKVVGMMEAGLFVQIADPYAEGLVSKDSMTDDFYEYNEERMIFLGRRTRRSFKIGDRVKVRVVRAEIDRRQTDLALMAGGSETPVPGKKRRVDRHRRS